jgi:hypothetical protein
VSWPGHQIPNGGSHAEDDLQLTLLATALPYVLNRLMAFRLPILSRVRATTASVASTRLFDVNRTGRLAYGAFIIVSARHSTTDANVLTAHDQGGRIEEQWRKVARVGDRYRFGLYRESRQQYSKSRFRNLCRHSGTV